MRVTVVSTPAEQREAGDEVILPEGVNLPTKPIPLMYGFSYEAKSYIGTASDFRLEDGRITAELSVDVSWAGLHKDDGIELVNLSFIQKPAKPR